MQKGDKFELGYEVTVDVRDGFRQIFKDANPLHTDQSFARSKGFAGEVMYGNILSGFLSHFIGEALPIKNVVIHSQQIKFFRPFFCGDNLVLKAEISEAFESVHVFIFSFGFFDNNGIEIAGGKVQIGVI
jgi:3-hydroxybutyryl-CoA dehydratase